MCEHFAKFLGNDYCFAVHTSVDAEDRGCHCCGVNDDGHECCWYEPQEEVKDWEEFYDHFEEVFEEEADDY